MGVLVFIDNATSRPEAAVAATVYAVNEISTVFMEAGIGALGIISSPTKRYQAADNFERFLSSRPQDIATALYNMPRGEKLRQVGAALVGFAPAATLFSRTSMVSRVEGVASSSVRERVLANIAESATARNSSDITQLVNKEVAYNFYRESGLDADRTLGHMTGIDFKQPVDIFTLPRGSKVVQYQILGRSVGGYFAPVGTSADVNRC